MAQVLKARHFDVAGVRERSNGPVIGFVEVAHLNDGSVRDHRQELTSEHLLSEATPLSGLLATLAKKARAFVLVGAEVRGIVTQADLNKPAVRAYLMGLISLLEMRLGFWVADGYPNETWRKALKPARIDAAEAVRRERAKRNPEVPLRECLQFCDKRVLLAGKENLRSMLGLTSKNKANDLLEHAEDLRNRLAHSQANLAQGTSWSVLLQRVKAIETAVHASDKAVERKVSSLSHTYTDGLWVDAGPEGE
jgi:hypothetical protein